MTESTFWKELKSGKFAQMVAKESRGKYLTNSKEVYHVVKPLLAETDDIETVYCLFLDTRNRILAIEKMFSGTISQAAIYPREIIKRLIKHKANGIIIIHNHPSGNTQPSSEDRAITKRIAIALEAVNARMLDHLIIGEGYHSLADDGCIASINKQINQLFTGKEVISHENP